jgi:hypothetical protein
MPPSLAPLQTPSLAPVLHQQVTTALARRRQPEAYRKKIVSDCDSLVA